MTANLVIDADWQRLEVVSVYSLTSYCYSQATLLVPFVSYQLQIWVICSNIRSMRKSETAKQAIHGTATSIQKSIITNCKERVAF